MTSIARKTLVWPAMILAGLALGGYVAAVWPDTSPRLVRLPYGEAMPKTPVAKARVVRVTASVDASQPELAGAVYGRELSVYEVGEAPMLDAVIGAPEPVDAH